MWRLLALLCLTACGARQPAPASLETMDISCRGHAVRAEIAADEPARERGLMFRRSLETDAGMLFIFPRPGEQAFWMKDTYVPLSIAFIDENGRIVNIEDMAPLDSQTLYRSQGAVKYALEMNRGWFGERGVGPGDTCDLGAAQER